MAKLRDTDLLGDDPAEESTGPGPTPGPPRAAAAQPPQQPRAEWDQQLAALAAQSPLLIDPEVLRVQREPRVMMAFNHMPVTYKERFAAEAKRRRMGLKEMLVDMMRSYGISVPPYDQIDGRRRG